MIRMWNTAHAHCSTTPKALSQSKPLPNITAIRMNTSSPAYMFPNRRSAREIGLAIRVTNSSRKLTGISSACTNRFLLPNGWRVSSPMKPPIPLTLML
ncbi:hypothetical protein D3C80_1933630 [compost metagenome]